MGKKKGTKIFLKTTKSARVLVMWSELNAHSKPIASYDDPGCLAFHK
jgi:hypothetical protein